MFLIVIVVFKFIIGLFGNRFRDKLVDLLEEGDIID